MAFGQVPLATGSAVDVFFTTKDNVRIAADYYAGQKSEKLRPALLLLHGGNRSRKRWQETGFVNDFKSSNYHMLAIDIRGRGDSESGDVEKLRRNPTLALADVEAAIGWLSKQPGVDPDRIALIGSSYGANLATSGLMARKWKVRTVVCFSATAMAYRFLELHESKYALPSGFFLAAAGERFRYAAPMTASRLAKDCVGQSKIKIVPGPWHAMSMYGTYPELKIEVKAWLDEAFAPGHPSHEFTRLTTPMIVKNVGQLLGISRAPSFSRRPKRLSSIKRIRIHK